MKKLFLTFVTLVAAFTFTAYAQNPPELSGKNLKTLAVEANYIQGLKSDIPGLQVSCAYFLGEMNSKKAVPILIEMFKDESNPGARLVAAWSLAKIGDPRGIELLKNEADKSDCDYSKCLCNYLYMDYCLKKYGKVLK